MVRCRRCGRCLTWPKSLSRGYGPVCWGKVNQAQEDLINYSPAEDLSLERGILISLHRMKRTVQIASTSSKNHRRREREYKKRGYSLVKDYSYHSYSLMVQKIQANKKSHFVAICYDELSGNKRDGKTTTNMTISLMEKTLNPSIKENKVLSYL